IECNAACDYAPVMTVDWELFDNRTVDSAIELVDDLLAGGTPTPTRGAPLRSFRDTARLPAGIPDDRPGVLEAAGTAGPASLAGLEVAREHDMEAPEPPAKDEAVVTVGKSPTGLTPVLTRYWDEEQAW